MKIAFCTTCKGRTQHLRLTLPRNLEDNPKSLFVVLDYNSQDGLTDFLISSCGDAIQQGRLVIYSYPEAEVFKMAHAKNMAHRCAIAEGADVLCNLDADNYAGAGFEDFIERHFATKQPLFLWAHMVKGLMARGISGRIVISKQAFLKAGGYDERYDTWAPDDKDMNQRLGLLGYERVQIDPLYLEAILHNDKMRFREYPHIIAELDSSKHQTDGLNRSAVANGGKAGCGVVFRNFDFTEPMGLDPFPTRIFGIGMHKTATTSLHHAFETLGFESAHWMSAHWAKAIWREMNQRGWSKTLEQHYALCDLPMTLLFRQLDKAYPGSKFVLTTREENGWLETVRKHYDPNFNEFRAGWDLDPFSHRCHQLLYGRTDFDEQTMLDRYRKHNKEVLAYFDERQQDLLVMPMDEGAGWSELCNFLGNLPIPRRPYPRSYAHY